MLIDLDEVEKVYNGKLVVIFVSWLSITAQVIIDI